jgi:hypothetical protein
VPEILKKLSRERMDSHKMSKYMKRGNNGGLGTYTNGEVKGC